MLDGGKGILRTMVKRNPVMTAVQPEIGQSKLKYKDKGLQEGCPRKTSQLIL